MEHKIYNQFSDQDQVATEELKRFASEAPITHEAARDYAETVMNKASTELAKRVRRTMLYQNKSYEEATRVVADSDPTLMGLYAFGRVIK